jgi:hypothetical protein
LPSRTTTTALVRRNGGAAERGLQSRIGRYDKAGTGDFVQQRRGLRQLQRFDIALQQIGFCRSMQQHTTEPVVKGGAAPEQAHH